VTENERSAFDDGGEARDSLRRYSLRLQSTHERKMCLFRRIWDALPCEQQFLVEEGIKNLILVQQILTEESGGLLCALDLSTMADHAEAVKEVAGIHPIYAELGQRTRDVRITPQEYLCAIACWKAGEEYTPEYVTTDRGLRARVRHPRWPETEKIEVNYIFGSSSPPPSEGG
jgi:hypothetical protein